MVNDISPGIPVDDHVFWGRYKAVLDPPVSADRILVGTCMEETEVEGFLILVVIHGEQHLLVQILRIIVVRVVTTDPPDIPYSWSHLFTGSNMNFS